MAQAFDLTSSDELPFAPMSATDQSPKPKLHWLRYKLKTLLLFMLMFTVTVGCAVGWIRYRQQQAAVKPDRLHFAVKLPLGDGSPRLGAAQLPPGPVRTGTEGSFASASGDVKAGGAHRARNDAGLIGEGGLGALAVNPQMFTKVRLAANVVVMAVNERRGVHFDPKQIGRNSATADTMAKRFCLA